MPGELITEDQPRIKFTTIHDGAIHTLRGDHIDELKKIALVQAKLESLGIIPILNDGLVGGNCSITFPDIEAENAFFISKSGKQPLVPMTPNDFVLLTSFDPTAWSATYKSLPGTPNTIRPSSDTPLHAAAFLHYLYSWPEKAYVCIHGHALAHGDQLLRAERAGMPISEEETLFSTPEDMQAVVKLFSHHSYPQHRCFIRRGHGFLLLAQSIEQAEEYIDTVIVPLIA